jgi:hypothetical protein
MTQIINLGTEIYVTDPCYSVPTWCQLKVGDVLPGEWIATVIYDELGGSNRNAEIHLVHKDHQAAGNLMYDWIGDFGVDSGQAGVFNAASYRDDAAAERIVTPQVDFSIGRHMEGDAWYEAMCKFTLAENGWGAYDEGVVSSSGYGDGMYAAYGAYDEDGKLVALNLVFIPQDPEDEYWAEEEEEEV